ncbi:hypothetical protein CYLTODRAFT_458571 [Cylindrobasidium torrendii FP15055 ss-10]|uniref:MYND-type domain-containing protein n=1 Tax=Cylindrobasidium torrendii FP15055 ss-10 TaxID=1314674 RepID=A0A0D7AY68_9AGAR|nr:hypothetical protein CYLTODRAFT_458571 [Cylindrobasidium torrendii FP15055 ss-10]
MFYSVRLTEHKDRLIGPCNFCGKITSYECNRCKNAFYCKTEHYNADLIKHEMVGTCHLSPDFDPNCVLARNFVPLSPAFRIPDVLIHTGLHIPLDQDSGYIRTRVAYNTNWRINFPMPIFDQIFPDGECPESVTFTHHEGKRLHYPVELLFSKMAMLERKPECINKAIRAFEDGTSGVRIWYGPILILRFSDDRMRFYLHAEDEDVRAPYAYIMKNCYKSL